jgi:hypothetical protein
MGRTLHYNIKGIVSSDSKRKLDQLEEKYCQEYEWTCEQPNLEYGWTKVCSNELNAHTVIRWIAECSTAIPNQITLYDEGSALYSPIVLHAGFARPNYEKIREKLDYWNSDKMRDYLHNPEFYCNVTSQETYFRALIKAQPEFGPLEAYVRPIITSAYLNNRDEFRTVEIRDSISLDMIRDFLKTEHNEEASYYDDIGSFPTVAVPEQKSSSFPDLFGYKY